MRPSPRGIIEGAMGNALWAALVAIVPLYLGLAAVVIDQLSVRPATALVLAALMVVALVLAAVVLLRLVRRLTKPLDLIRSGPLTIAAGGGGGGGGAGPGGGAGGAGGSAHVNAYPPIPAKPDVRIHVVGNTASQEWLRWFHLVCFNESEIIAKDVRIEIFVMGATGGAFQRWMWTGAEEVVDLRKGRPVEIPLFIGALEDHPESPQYRVAIPKGNWFLTDQTFLKDGKAAWPLLPTKNHRYAAQLALRWTDGVRDVGRLRQCFSIRIPPPELGEEADVLHVDCDG